jgi:threonine dehydrogenase-like Zn-dependent dehydrogenase
VLYARGDDAFAADLRPERLEWARELGALDGDTPVDAAVVTAPAGINDALRRLAPGGTLLVFAADHEPTPTALDAIYRKELTLIGSRSATPAYLRAALGLPADHCSAAADRR